MIVVELKKTHPVQNKDLPQYGHKQWQAYFGRTFDIYTKLWKFQQQHRQILDSKYGLKRWQIGEIASKIGQLYYHYYLRTSETNYLNEAYSFYAAIRGRAYYSRAAKEDRVPYGMPGTKAFMENGERPARRENPHKYLLYKPTLSQVLVFLASGFKELPANGALLLYLSADGCFSTTKYPEDMGYDLGGVLTSSKREGEHKKQKEAHCLYPGDLYPFTRRPLFVIVDSDNSFVFQHIPRYFGQPLVTLMSPQDIPPAFHDQQHNGSLFTLFLHSPLTAFCYCCNLTSIPIHHWERCQSFVDRFVTEASRLFTRSQVGEYDEGIYSREEYRCSMCPYTCTTEKAFLKHSRTCEPKDENGADNRQLNLSCPICGKDRNGEELLALHMKKHKDNKHFCCDICKFKTLQLKKLIQHRRMHTGEKPHLCPFCSYRSARRDNLRSHARRVHKKDNLPCDTFTPRSMILRPSKSK
ncbi:Protein SCAI [Popillia japonica]|uniref:Protein SCAI n=1 Tax=Popillia japonica TaxID=7064 RepID=A0AAW1JJD4_POPJA